MTSVFSIKTNWSEVNKLPHDLFAWQGLDGSEVVMHTFENPADGYNAEMGPRATLGTWGNYQDKDLHGESAVLAAKASLAARRQSAHYMDFHFALLGQEGSVTKEMVYAEAARAGMDVNKLKADMADPGIEKSLTSSIALAHRLGVDGTPTFVLNGKFRPGAVDDETLASEMKS